MIKTIWDALLGKDGELARLKKVLISVIVVTVICSLIILLFHPSIKLCLLITCAFLAFSIYRLFSIKNFIGMFLVGEGFEAASALVSKEANMDTGMFDNPLIRKYVLIILRIFFFQNILFLMLIFFVNFTAGGLPEAILIAMLLIALLAISGKVFKKTVATAIVTMILVFSVVLVFHLFSQTGFYTRGIMEKIHIVPASTARLINEYHAIKAKQIEDIDNDCLEKGIAWQKANPGKEPPQWFTDALAKN